MSTSLFSTLPPEIICKIFRFTDSFDEVAALARTARIFYFVWRENPATISQAVAPRVFPNLGDAEQLLDFQEEAETGAAGQLENGRKQEPIVRVKRLLSNARCASAVSNDWVRLSGFDVCFERDVRPHEIARFQHAFYCVWAVGVMATTPHLKEKASTFLDGCSPRELCIFNELAEYAQSWNENNFRSVGLDFSDEVWKTGCNLVRKLWQMEKWSGWYVPNTTITDFHVFYDDTQPWLERVPDKREDDNKTN